MIILAIESSGPVASAAIWKDGEVLSEKTGPFKVTHSETLLPLLSEAVRESGIELKSADYVAVSGGPGSFTGLRIGSATAKGLGLALNKKLIHVPTLEAMAYNFFGCDGIIVPAMDARRDQVYAGIYHFESDVLKTDMAASALSIGDLLNKLNAEYNGCAIQMLGDGADRFRDEITSASSLQITFAKEEQNRQRAASVAKLGAVMAAAGKTVDADDEAPVYLRPSQAERVRAEKLAGN